MECPTCRYPVPAEWSLCRRCGAPLHSEPEDSRVAVPAALHRRRSAATTATTTTTTAPGPVSASAPTPAARAAAAFQSAPPDTLLPGALPRPDNLLPRATRSTAAPAHAGPARAAANRLVAANRSANRRNAFAREHWRRILVIAVVAVALTLSLVAVWPVLFRSSTTGGASTGATNVAQEARATALLRTVTGGGRTLYAAHRSFGAITASALSAHSYRVPVVGSTTAARAGQVSMLATAKTLTLATPADANRCVFARDEPATVGTRFVTVTTGTCRAGAAPTTGWSTR